MKKEEEERNSPKNYRCKKEIDKRKIMKLRNI